MSQQTSINNLNNMNDEDSNLVDSILNDLNPSQNPKKIDTPPNYQENNQQNMNEKLTPHFFVSVLKSAIRIFGFTMLMSSIPFGITILIIAEVISIFEELV